MTDYENTQAIPTEECVELYRRNNPSAEGWAVGYGTIGQSLKTQARLFSMSVLLSACGIIGDEVPLFDRLTAADRIASASIWLLVHGTCTKKFYPDRRADSAFARIFNTPTRPEPILEILQQLHTGGRKTCGVGFHRAGWNPNPGWFAFCQSLYSGSYSSKIRRNTRNTE